MPSEYYACVIAAVSASFIEVALVSIVTIQTPTLKQRAIKHIMNEKGVEVDLEGQPIVQKATFVRLVKIAKPVSFKLYYFSALTQNSHIFRM